MVCPGGKEGRTVVSAFGSISMIVVHVRVTSQMVENISSILLFYFFSEDFFKQCWYDEIKIDSLILFFYHPLASFVTWDPHEAIPGAAVSTLNRKLIL